MSTKLVAIQALNLHCGQSIPLSGEKSKLNNCFWVNLYSGRRSYGRIDKCENGHFIGVEFTSNEKGIPIKLTIEEIINFKIEIHHYKKWHKFTFNGVYDRLINLRRKVIISYLKDYKQSLYQSIFNIRSLRTKNRYDFLKLLIDNFTARKEGFGYVAVMQILHSNFVFLHPSFSKESSKIQALLQGFIDTKELTLINGYYHLTGHAYKTRGCSRLALNLSPLLQY